MSLDAVTRSLRTLSIPVLRDLSAWLEQALEQPIAGELPASDLIPGSPAISIPRTVASQLPMLLGAGPGLTPAGDDLLAGVLLSLHRINRDDLALMIWKLLEPQLSLRTNLISSAHLCLAAQGQCAESMNELLALVFAESSVVNGSSVVSNSSRGQCLEATATRIKRLVEGMGATSGWDTLAGMSLVLLAL